MPTYEYQCDACGNRFEKFQSITAAPLKKCINCGKSKVRRLIGTGAGILFKGSGFYITDYRDASYAEKAKAETGAATGDTKSADPKSAETKSTEGKSTESKPVAKTETKPAAPSAKSDSKPPKKPRS
jgi:putative FmdB family regulatory protein